MRIIETKVYQFDELTDSAKEKARQWWREASAGDTDTLDHVIEDAATCGALMGIDLRTHAVKLMGGGTRYEPCVYYSGFSSQGDGACFEGTWRANKCDAEALRKHAPEDSQLHRIADALAVIAAQYPEASAAMRHSGHYSHSGCMSVESDSGIEEWDDAGIAEQKNADFPHDDVKDLMRSFADWIYSQLEKEYEYQNADEQVDDSIRANEYEFTDDGSMA